MSIEIDLFQEIGLLAYMKMSTSCYAVGLLCFIFRYLIVLPLDSQLNCEKRPTKYELSDV